jgi:hypothetical protein
MSSVSLVEGSHFSFTEISSMSQNGSILIGVEHKELLVGNRQKQAELRQSLENELKQLKTITSSTVEQKDGILTVIATMSDGRVLTYVWRNGNLKVSTSRGPHNTLIVFLAVAGGKLAQSITEENQIKDTYRIDCV